MRRDEISKRKRQIPLSPSMLRAFQSFAVDSDGSAVTGSSHTCDDERFYAFVRVCHRFRRRLSEVQVSQLLRDVGFPKNEANEWGSIFHHCYGALSTPIPQYAISLERDEILRSLNRPYQKRESR